MKRVASLLFFFPVSSAQDQIFLAQRVKRKLSKGGVAAFQAVLKEAFAEGRSIIRFLLWLFLFSPSAAFAQPPKTGLVLAGGGALGFAHVGVLKVLEREKIPVDIITGTSMGSIIGAGYACGRTASELEEFIRATDWEKIFNESAARESLPFRSKAGRNSELLGDLKLGVKNGKLQKPTGAIRGVNIFPVLQHLYDTQPGEIDFDKLPIPYRAIAADIETGEPVVLGSGELALATRASMSVPGVFSPVEIDGRLLVDGGIVNNLPMDVARSLGAERLIVVELPADFKKRDELDSPLAVSGQIISLLLAQNSKAQLETLAPQDVLILPKLTGYSPTDFRKAEALVKIGEQAAEAAVERLRAFRIDDAAYERFAKVQHVEHAQVFPIEFIHLENKSTVPDEKILRKLSLVVGESFDSVRAEQDVASLLNMGYFTSVRYRTAVRENQRGVIFSLEPKPWLEQYFRVGFLIQDDFDGNSAYSLSTALRVNDLNAAGGMADFEAEIGFSPRLSAEFYQPLAKGSSWFFNPLIEWRNDPLLLGNQENVIARYHRKRFGGSIKAGYEIDETGEVFLGVERYFGRIERNIGDEELPERDFDIGGLIGGTSLDRLDDPDFPKEGYRFDLKGKYALESLGSPSDFQQATAVVVKPFTFGRNTLLIRSDAGVSFSDLPAQQLFTIGGFFDFSGVPINSIAASDYAIGRLVYYRKVAESGSGLLGLEVYAGGSLEIGSFRIDDSRLPDRGVVPAGSLFLGVDTPLLPVYFGGGFAEEGTRSLYLGIGRQFRNSRN